MVPMDAATVHAYSTSICVKTSTYEPENERSSVLRERTAAVIKAMLQPGIRRRGQSAEMLAAERKKKDPNAPKRTQPAYMLWLNENRSKLAKPGMSTVDVSKAAGVE
ncbi:hypothetical protein NECAME_14932 [Necator americanus]|uniref:HMG box domain-containing protein n=1 Tax=Necator americanus TaxID=51031 RepID=W2SKG1_NECAM|nr:hypothetical protein NECAME_14932 [Necator americanus]ETN70159.1 hypothetical protein NECAME_14932 [Necator americanus]